MCNCGGCLERRAVENLVRVGLASDENIAYHLLELNVSMFELTIPARLARLKQLGGPHGYTIYKMLEARRLNNG